MNDTTGPLPPPLTQGGKFAQAPAEVRAFFDAKAIKPTWHWQDFEAAEHAHAFTVAKTAGFDVINDLHDAIKTAITEQQDFATFAKNITPTLQAKGWWGRKVAIDPASGEASVVQLGSVRRLGTIYWANTRTAYAAGQWTRIQATKRLLPYLEYLHTVAAHPRPEHLAWVGTVLHADDQWWESHYPPNGWKCQCRVRQLSRGEAAPRLTPDPPSDFGHQKFVNRRTGTTLTTPRGIDPGWATNPGMTRLQEVATVLAGRLDAMSPENRAVAITDIVASPIFRMMATGAMDYNDQAARSGTRPDMVDLGGYSLPVAQAPADLVSKMGASSDMVIMSVATGAKQAESRKNDRFSLDDYQKLQALLNDPSASRIFTPSKVIIRGVVKGRTYRAVIKVNQNIPHRFFLVSMLDKGRIKPRQQ